MINCPRNSVNRDLLAKKDSRLSFFYVIIPSRGGKI